MLKIFYQNYQNMRIFLIGFMGSGKTTIGKALSEKLNMTFVDLDRYIEQKKQTTIPKIFQTEGERAFRNEEKQALSKILQKNNVIISTGGGLPCFNKNMETINHNGLSVYLKTTPENLFERLKSDFAHRPLLKNKTKNEQLQFIKNTLNQRKLYYEKAKLVVSTDNLTEEEVTRNCLAEIENYVSSQ